MLVECYQSGLALSWQSYRNIGIEGSPAELLGINKENLYCREMYNINKKYCIYN